MALLAALGFLALALLPGAWIAYGLRLDEAGFGTRLLLAAVLSPLVLVLEFASLRLMGVPFAVTAPLVILVNVPALALVWRRRASFSLPEPRAVVAAGAVMLLSALFLAPYVLDAQKRSYLGHAWMRADTAYILAWPDFRLEDPELVGIAIGYPWGSEVQQVLQSFALGQPPVSAYIWSNLIWVAVCAGLVALITGSLGGDRLARANSVIWLFFGVNVAGFVAQRALPGAWVETLLIWGDFRYTPWFVKFYIYNPVPAACAMVLALLVLAVRPAGGKRSEREILLVSSLVLAGLALYYPPLFPAGAAALASRPAAALLLSLASRQGLSWRTLVAPGAALVLLVALQAGYVAHLGRDRVRSALMVSSPDELLRQAAELVVVLSPLLLGAAVAMPRLWRTHRAPALALVLAGLGSGFLYVAFHIPFLHNEYKYVFTAAAALAPFPALALMPWLRRAGRAAPVLAAGIAVAIAWPMPYQMRFENWPWMPDWQPPLLLDDFALRLAPSEPLADLTDAIRLRTPADGVLVVEQTTVRLPTLTQRQLFVPPEQERAYPGVGLRSRQILDRIRGYGPDILSQRRATIRALYHPEHGEERAQALDEILAFGRPLVLVASATETPDLVRWLVDDVGAEIVYRGEGGVVCVIDAARETHPGAPAPVSRRAR
jgi:hypothetical protein